MPRRDIDDDDPESEKEEEKKKSSKKRSRSQYSDKRSRSQYSDKRSRSQYFDEDEDEEEDYGGGVRGRHRAKQRKASGSEFFDLEAFVDDNVEEDDEDEDGEDDFIVDDGAELPDTRTLLRLPRLPHEEDVDQEDVVALERSIQARYARYDEEEEETTDDVVVEQQALLPSVRDPKLWMVKCAIGHEREVAVCLMQKCIDRGPELMQIRSAIALDHLKNYIYIEADKEAHVKEACKGIPDIFTGSKILLVPIKEMTDVLSVESSKAIELSRDTWVRMKSGTYKGDLAKVVDVDNERQRVTVKLIPRIDLQALANKLVEGRQVPNKKTFTPPPRFMNVALARQMHIRVQRKRDPVNGDYFENINGMLFKDGFLYKNVSLKSISTQSIQPSFDEVEKFLQPAGDNGDGDMASLSTLFSNRKKCNFTKGDRVIIVKGDLKNLKGAVEKVEGGAVQIKPYDEGLPKTLAVSEKELCKYFEPGNHVKVVSGATEGATGMVVTVERHLVNIVSDTTKEVIQVFSDNVVEISSEVTPCKTRIGGPANGDRNGDGTSRFAALRTPNRVPQSPAGRMPRGGHQMNSGGRFGGGRGHNSLIGSSIRVRLGCYKGCRGIVKDVNGQTVCVELEAQMKIITVNRDAILASSTYREPPGYGSGCETPMHPYMTPMRDTLAYS